MPSQVWSCNTWSDQGASEVWTKYLVLLDLSGLGDWEIQHPKFVLISVQQGYGTPTVHHHGAGRIFDYTFKVPGCIKISNWMLIVEIFLLIIFRTSSSFAHPSPECHHYLLQKSVFPASSSQRPACAVIKFDVSAGSWNSDCTRVIQRELLLFSEFGNLTWYTPSGFALHYEPMLLGLFKNFKENVTRVRQRLWRVRTT